MEGKLYKKIRKALAKEPQVLSAYVFGSYTKDQSRSESDFDLAVVVKDRKKVSEDKIYKLIRDISFPKDLDLCVVDIGSSPLFLYQIISKGKRIYEGNSHGVQGFEATVMHNYYDSQYMRNIYFESLSSKFNYAD